MFNCKKVLPQACLFFMEEIKWRPKHTVSGEKNLPSALAAHAANWQVFYFEAIKG